MKETAEERCKRKNRCRKWQDTAASLVAMVIQQQSFRLAINFVLKHQTAIDILINATKLIQTKCLTVMCYPEELPF